MTVDFGQRDPRTLSARDTGDQHSDRPCPDHQDGLPGAESAAADVVDGHGGRLNQSRMGQQKVRRQPHQQFHRHVPALLQRSRRVDPDEVETVADVVVPGAARRTVTAPAQRHHGQRVTDGPVGDIRAQRGNATRHLVSEHGVRRHPAGHGSVEDVQVRPADAGIGDGDLCLSRTGWRGHRFPDSNHTGTFVVSGQHHVTFPLVSKARSATRQWRDRH